MPKPVRLEPTSEFKHLAAPASFPTASARRGDLLPQLHHPPVALHQIVGEGHPWVGKKAEYVLLAHAEAQQEIVANPSRRTAAAPGGDGGGDQRGLRRMKRQTLSEESVITSLDAAVRPGRARDWWRGR